MNATSANNTMITQTITILTWNFKGQMDGLTLSDMQMLFESSCLTQFRWLYGPSLDAPWHVRSLPGLCSDLQPCLHVSPGENCGDLLRKFMRYKNPLKLSSGNTLFHDLADESSTCSGSSFHVCTGFLQVSRHCSRVMLVRPKILTGKEACSLFPRWK